MKRFWLGIAAMAAVSACGGNPWLEDGDGEGEGQGIVIPEDLAGDLEGFTYDPVAKTLLVRGLSLDSTPFEATYTRKPALDVPGYEAYTTQDSALERHATAYVQEIDGTRAAIVVTGGQFGHYFGGSHYSRDGNYTPPVTGQVTYVGKYVGLMNGPGDGGDLIPVDPGTPADVRPVQAAEVTGSVLINADFTDTTVNGVVYDRVLVDSPTVEMTNLELAPTAILEDGTFVGDVTQENIDRGTYGGLFGGTDASAVAGTLFVDGHVDAFDNEEEYGLFVLSQCGTGNADPLCDQTNR